MSDWDIELREKIGREVYDEYSEIRNVKPIRQGEFLGVEEDKFYIALGEEEVYELSPLAYYIWALCDGEHTVRDIANLISENTGVEYYRVIEPLLIVLSEMKRTRLIDY